MSSQIESIGNNLYPTKLEFLQPIGNGSVKSIFNNVLINSTEAISIKIEINSNLYQKEDVKKALNQACQRFLEYFY